MEIKELYEALGENKEQLLVKAMQCKNTAEIISIASENNISIEEETAQKILDFVSQKDRELSEDELGVAAGGNNAKGKQKIDSWGRPYVEDFYDTKWCPKPENFQMFGTCASCTRNTHPGYTEGRCRKP